MDVKEWINQHGFVIITSVRELAIGHVIESILDHHENAIVQSFIVVRQATEDEYMDQMDKLGGYNGIPDEYFYEVRTD